MAGPHETGPLERLRHQARERLGMEVRPGKEALFRARTGRHMQELGIGDADAYLRLLESDPDGAPMAELMDLLTTNHTTFFRDPETFRWLRERLAATPAGAERQTIWCAGSSTGEEPYTVAMTAWEAMGPEAAARIRILATDVSATVLAAAREAVYPREATGLVPEPWRHRYFEAGGPGWEGYCRVRTEVRAMVHLRRLNLVDPLPAIGPFPYIFCRNVMIYFSAETRRRVAAALLERLTPEGYLVTGSAERLENRAAKFVRTAVYQRSTGSGAWA